MTEHYVIGVDAGGTKVAYGLFNRRGAIIDRIQHPTDVNADGPAFSDIVVENVKTLLEQNKLSFDELAGVGIGMPSFIMHDKGHVLVTSSMPRIKDFPMWDYLRERLPVRVMLDNDANAAALAEYRHGAGRGARHMVYIVIGTGLGSGIIIDGKLFQGSYGWAGECGHMLASPDEGLMCGCENRGCYMSYTAGKHLPDRVRSAQEKGIKSVLTPETAEGYLLREAYKAGDPLARELAEQMAHYLAVCVFNIYQMLNINTFVFGGGLADFEDLMAVRVREEFDKYNHIPLPAYFKMAEEDRG
jgi:glucokinase